MITATNHYSAQLRYVRALCLQTEYRKCVQTCRDLLEMAHVQAHPIQKAFLLFYSALAHDEMARAMHHNSTVKVPALETAGQLYLAALHALPSPEDTDLLCAELVQKAREDLRFGCEESSPTSDGYPYEYSHKTTPIFSPLRLRRESVSLRSLEESPTMTTSDLEDLESHDSFSELMTPTRVLTREYSKTSSLDTTPLAERSSPGMSSHRDRSARVRMQRDFSRMSLLETPPRKPMSQGRMRHIRPDFPPKQFYVPPKLANTSQLPQIETSGPKLRGSPGQSPRDSIISNPDLTLERRHGSAPVSPISRRHSSRYSSDILRTSAVSPLTPTHDRHDSVSSDGAIQEALCLRLNDHLDSMRMQLETHITLVQQTKEQLRDFQTERALSKRTANIDTLSGTLPTNITRDARRASCAYEQEPLISSSLPRARSYWSFVPDDAKAAEKSRRIRDGRERKWERRTERFDARKYQNLCERALDEL